MEQKELLALLKGKLEPSDYEKATAYLTDVSLKAKELATELKTAKDKLGEFEGKVKEQELEKFIAEAGIDEEFTDLIKSKFADLDDAKRGEMLEQYRASMPSIFKKGDQFAENPKPVREPTSRSVPLPTEKKKEETSFPNIPGALITKSGIILE